MSLYPKNALETFEDSWVTPCTGIKIFAGKKEGRMAIKVIPPPTPVMAVIKEVKAVINIRSGVYSMVCLFVRIF